MAWHVYQSMIESYKREVNTLAKQRIKDDGVIEGADTLDEKSGPDIPSIGKRIIEGLKELSDALKNKEPLNKKFTVHTVFKES